MKRLIAFAFLLGLVGSARADIIYLQNGTVLSGTVLQVDPAYIEVALPDRDPIRFTAAEVFQATDDQGRLLFPLPNPTGGDKTQILPSPELSSSHAQNIPAKTLSAGYRTIYRFPLWPLVGGTLLFGYIGITQLHQSSQIYQDSVEREEAGLEFNSLRDRSLKHKTWGQISLAGAAACLIVGLTPHREKIPIQSSLRVIPTQTGFAVCLDL
jgi:hypothetical protein